MIDKRAQALGLNGFEAIPSIDTYVTREEDRINMMCQALVNYDGKRYSKMWMHRQIRELDDYSRKARREGLASSSQDKYNMKLEVLKIIYQTLIPVSTQEQLILEYIQKNNPRREVEFRLIHGLGVQQN